jgi:hypothetical protein
VAFGGGEARLKTVWLNEKSDVHKTLRREIYAVR